MGLISGKMDTGWVGWVAPFKLIYRKKDIEDIEGLGVVGCMHSAQPSVSHRSAIGHVGCSRRSLRIEETEQTGHIKRKKGESFGLKLRRI